jgi:hypothetical protein
MDEELEAEEREEISAHFVACRACDEVRARGEKVRAALRTPTPSLPAGLAVAVLERIGGASPRDLAWREALPSIRRLAAAVALLFAGTAAFALLPGPSRSESSEPLAVAGAWNGTPEEPSLDHERELLLALVLPEATR